jgi:hypothetical protein
MHVLVIDIGRNEIFTPSYIMGTRPAFAFVPSIAEYGSTFKVTMAAGTAIANIVSVVLMDPGSDTHSSNMAVRNQLLDFSPGGGQDLLVTAPANTYMAPASKESTVAARALDTLCECSTVLKTCIVTTLHAQ